MTFASRHEWEGVSADPDPVDDLGYGQTEWETVRAGENGCRHLIFLPTDMDLLKQEAFVIACESTVVDVTDRR